MKSILKSLVAATFLGSTAHAATFNVTRTNDPVPDGCNVNDCSLREAVIEADKTVTEDVIVLPAGIHLIDLIGDFDNSEETGDLDISTNMNFVGAPSTIDGQNLGRIMDIRSGANVTLQDLTLQNANSSLDTNGSLNGGALQISGGSLTAVAVTFNGNSAQGLGGGIYASNGATVDIDGCFFTNNNGGSGASISIDGGLTVRSTVFRANMGLNAGDRGAVAYVFAGTGGINEALFENVTFDQNVTAGSGGAVVFLGRKLRIDGLVATSNKSTTNHGGVLFVSGTGHAKQIEIVNVIFNGNTADDNGGAISFGGSSDTLDIRHSSFISNSSGGWGGALSIAGGGVVVTNSTFSGNQTSDIGGAIHLINGDLTLRHATFSENSATSGGAMYIRGVATFGNNLIDGACFIFDDLDVTSLGGNVEGNGDSCNLDAGSDLANQSAEQLGLQPLRDNIGLTPTHELTPGSAARGQGEPSICESVEIDQLYELRESECNSGAVESNTIFRDGLESGRMTPGVP